MAKKEAPLLIQKEFVDVEMSCNLIICFCAEITCDSFKSGLESFFSIVDFKIARFDLPPAMYE
jgi:hypothetical protein